MSLLVGGSASSDEVKPLPPIFFQVEGVEGRNYSATSATDPLCANKNTWEQVLVGAWVHSDCPLTANEVEAKMRVELTKFCLKPRTAWWEGTVSAGIQCVELKNENQRSHWVYRFDVGWFTTIGTRSMKVGQTGGVGIRTGRTEAKEVILGAVADYTENFLAKYVEANLACHGE